MKKYFQNIFINNFVGTFRNYDNSKLVITISGLNNFINKNYEYLHSLIQSLELYGIRIELVNPTESVDELHYVCENLSNGSHFQSYFSFNNLSSLIELSSRSTIPLIGILIIKIVANVICKFKILYKAIVLDLDETLWKGTLSEEGIEGIKRNMNSKEAIPYISFMKYIKALAEEFGIFVAICSRNDCNLVSSAIDELDESIFPLKHQIDYVIANNNDKSKNISIVAKELSILPSSIVFIDDNQIIREEIKSTLPEVFVPEWNTHDELTTTLLVGCIFDRTELSIKSQNRRKQYRVILAERSKASLPSLPIKAIPDNEHSNATELYLKSNQFNFSQNNRDFHTDAKSIYFELYRADGETLGVCAALTFVESHDSIIILNWAMSCRFFEIGVEESLLLYIQSLSKSRNIYIRFNDSGLNQKAKDLLAHYNDIFVSTSKSDTKEINIIPESKARLQSNTNLYFL